MSGKWPNKLEKEYFENLRTEITGLLVLWYQWGLYSSSRQIG